MTLQPLSPLHANVGLRLSTQAGWNQTLADWQLLLGLSTGYGFFDEDELIATALYLPYPPIAWISMVLVDGRYRRRGLATQLMEQCLEDIDRVNLTAMLDATETGAKVYSRLGFSAVFGLSRLEGNIISMQERAGTHCESIPRSDMNDACSLDRSAFPGDRTRLIERMVVSGASVCVRDRTGRISGFAWMRQGRQWPQIGPVLTRNIGAAADLINRLADTCKTPFIVDIPLYHDNLLRRLYRHGFEKKREFVRMIRGGQPVIQPPYAIAGPELG